MCCLVTTLFLLGPRAAILVWWLLQPARWNATFSGSFIWPILGFFVLPWVTLAWVLVAPGGIVAFDWVWLGLALLVDIGTWVGGGYGNRDRIPGMS